MYRIQPVYWWFYWHGNWVFLTPRYITWSMSRSFVLYCSFMTRWILLAHRPEPTSVPIVELLKKCKVFEAEADFARVCIANGRELSDIEETTLSRWILDMHHHGLPLQISNVRYLAQLLLSAWMKPSNAENVTINKLWVNQFIKHHPELKSKYTCPYNYQHAKCEDPGLMKN